MKKPKSKIPGGYRDLSNSLNFKSLFKILSIPNAAKKAIPKFERINALWAEDACRLRKPLSLIKEETGFSSTIANEIATRVIPNFTYLSLRLEIIPILAKITVTTPLYPVTSV